MGFFGRLRESLTRTAGQIGGRLDALVGRGADARPGGAAADADTLDSLEELLLSADIGVSATTRILSALREPGRDGRSLRAQLRETMLDILRDVPAPPARVAPLHVVLVVGVNGTGKTTTVGKIANLLRQEGHRPLVCAADTFRAAAVEQLEVWAGRAGVEMVRAQDGADPAAVVFDGLASARAKGCDTVLVDTAGRLHTRVNLMRELDKIRRVVARDVPGAPHEVWLVLDATVGQNGVVQAREFVQVAGVTGIVLTKLDGTAKGGVAVAIASDLRLPIRYVGIGEGLEDIVPFDAEDYVTGVLGVDG